jgi:Tol biopolymer transport system component
LVLLAVGGLGGGSGGAIPAMASPASASAAGSPGGAVVFASDVGVFVANSDGSAVTRLTRGEFDEAPVWSPDNTQIAFERLTGRDDDSVMVMNADGTHLRRLGPGNDVAWSPDGSKLLFDREVAPSVDGLFIANPDGSGVERLATGWGGDWSPDGRKIVYASDTPGSALGVIGIDGQPGFLVGHGTPVDWEWSPDRHQIAYALQDDPTVYLLDTGIGSVRQLARAAAAVDWVDWSPDGSQIAIHAGNDVDLVTTANGEQHLLSAHAEEPLWSPDGSRIAFVSRQNFYTYRLLTSNPDGSDRRVISSDNDCVAFNLWFDWAGDDNTLLFEKPRSAGDGCDLWRADLSDRTQTPITHAFPSGGNFTDLSWAPTTVVAHPEPRQFVSPTPAQTVPTKATIYDLAADGANAAIVTGSETGPVCLWPRGKGLRKIPRSSVEYERLQLVAAGDRIAWTEDNGGGIPTYFLTVVHDRDGTESFGDSAYLANDGLGDLAGDGPLLVYTTWHYNDSNGGTKLWRITGKRAQLLRHWPDMRDVVAVDAGRIAVLSKTGKLTLLNQTGRQLASFRLPAAARGADASSFRLTGRQLLVLRGNTLDIRNATNGKLERQRQLADIDGPLTLDGAHGDIAVYNEGIAIHLLRLSTGEDVVLQLPNEEGPAGAALEPDGLYYTYNQGGSSQHGRLSFLTTQQLTQLLASATP